MEHKRLPRGAKRTSPWIEVYSFAIPKGWNNEVTICRYEADVEYADGFVMPASMVTVYDAGNCVYKQAFYGETAEDDAMRNGMDVANKRAYAA